jgi:thiamine kinase-like enzyme
MNFFIIIKNKSTNEIIENIFYREYSNKFKALSDSINHEEEIQITKLLAEKDYGPKFLFEVKDSFCITQFLVDTKTLPREKYFDKNIIEQLCTILNYFTSFSYVYKYEINNDSIKLSPINNTNVDNKKIHLTKNQYEKSIKDLYDNSKNAFNNFYEQFIRKYSKEKKPEEYKKIELVKYHLDNYKKIYNENSVTKGFYVINHNDVLDANILYREKDNKIFLIDHEYFILNLPGHDIAYYLIESFFYNEPEYKSELNKVDFDKLFLYYEVFINKFIESNKFIENEESGKEFME